MSPRLVQLLMVVGGGIAFVMAAGFLLFVITIALVGGGIGYFLLRHKLSRAGITFTSAEAFFAETRRRPNREDYRANGDDSLIEGEYEKTLERYK